MSSRGQTPAPPPPRANIEQDRYPGRGPHAGPRRGRAAGGQRSPSNRGRPWGGDLRLQWHASAEISGRRAELRRDELDAAGPSRKRRSRLALAEHGVGGYGLNVIASRAAYGRRPRPDQQ